MSLKCWAASTCFWMAAALASGGAEFVDGLVAVAVHHVGHEFEVDDSHVTT